jgi:hypothetical protein
VHGFAPAVFCRVGIALGKLRWRSGHDGHAQTSLAADRAPPWAPAKRGEIGFLGATPQEREKVACFQAIEDRT